MKIEEILQSIDSPKHLEALYQQSPEEFTQAFPEVFAQHPDLVILQVWHERLSYESSQDGQDETKVGGWNLKTILVIVVLSILAGILAKIPHFVPIINDEWFYTRNLGFIILMTLTVYFLIEHACQRKTFAIILGLALVGLVYLDILPIAPKSQIVILSCIHMPFFFWSLLGVAFLAGQWKSLSGRMDFIRYNGELLIYTTIILIGGMVLTGLTVALFRLIDLQIEDWYQRNVVIYGAVASPLVATFIANKIAGERIKLAPVLARIFTPLFLLTVVVYLVTMIIRQKSPYTDRDFLIAFNALDIYYRRNEFESKFCWKTNRRFDGRQVW